MRILFVNHSSYLSGATISCLNLMAGLGEDVVPVFVTREDGPIMEKLRGSGIDWYILQKKGLLGINYIISFLKILQSEKIDLVHLNTLTPFCKYAGIASYLKRIPVVWVVRENPLISRSRRLKFWLQKLANRIVFVDNDTRKKLLSGGINNTDIIYNGVDTDIFRPVKSDYLFERFNIDKNTKLIGYIGMITERKGLEYLIKSLPLIKGESDNFKLVIVGGHKPGDVKYFSELKKLIKHLSLEDDIFFTGLLPDVRAALNSLDIVVLPSLEERCSRTLLESLACEKAVVATRVGGTPEIIEDRINGILIESADEKQIAGAVMQLLRNSDLRRRLGTNGRLKAERMFDLKCHREKMKKLYLEIVERQWD
ncbi:MAG: glycosyltransferase family 4 protein [Nitrospirota bacterium]